MNLHQSWFIPKFVTSKTINIRTTQSICKLLCRFTINTFITLELLKCIIIINIHNIISMLLHKRIHLIIKPTIDNTQTELFINHLSITQTIRTSTITAQWCSKNMISNTIYSTNLKQIRICHMTTSPTNTMSKTDRRFMIRTLLQTTFKHLSKATTRTNQTRFNTLRRWTKPGYTVFFDITQTRFKFNRSLPKN